jgi:hypothetical protein
MLISCSAIADVYTYIDAQGNRVFTDQPRRHAEKLDIGPGNQIKAVPQKPSHAPSVRPRPGPLFRYQLLRILAPEPDGTIRNTQGNLIVTVTTDPALEPGHTYRLLLDSKAYGEPGRSPVFALTNIDRGTHQLSVEILDEYGRVVERTPNQPLHLIRVSLAQKRLAQPCKTGEYGVRPECPINDKPPEETNGILSFF